MRAIVITNDYPFTEISEVEIKDYKDYYKHLCSRLFDVVRVGWNNEDISIYIDDEGMLKPNFGRNVKGYPQPLFGNLVITGGVDNRGETLSAPEWLTTDNVTEYVSNMRYRTREGE